MTSLLGIPMARLLDATLYPNVGGSLFNSGSYHVLARAHCSWGSAWKLAEDYCIIARSSARRRKAEQGGSDDHSKREGRMITDTNVSSHLRASGRLGTNVGIPAIGASAFKFFSPAMN